MKEELIDVLDEHGIKLDKSYQEKKYINKDYGIELL